MEHTEKIMIEISAVKAVEDRRVLVTLADGRDCYFPIDHAERFGNRLYIPAWLGEHYRPFLEATI